MAAAAGFCLACGQATMANNRRILRSEACSNVQKASRDLFADRLKDKDREIVVESVLGDAFHERKSQLLSMLDSAIEKMPNTSRTVSGLSESSADPHTPSRVCSQKCCVSCCQVRKR